MWWLGDWWAYGEHRYGERAAAVLDSEYAFQTFMDAGWVAKKVETSRRHEALSWSHHREVAKLPADDQDTVLAAAAENGWPRQEMRREMRDKRRADKFAEMKAASKVSGTYGVIYADPTWSRSWGS